MKTPPRAARNRRRAGPWWAALPADELLDVRLCDLGLEVAGSVVEARTARLQDELARKGLRFRPYVWLSTDWFTPEGSTGFAIPFYLAHPRLVRLEHRQMFEAEGATHGSCMRLLRHEAGHAFDNAYRLHRRAAWREVFGRYGAPYRRDYQADPASRGFVQHLGRFYAQSHPAEDWAETFAVWLNPGSRWRAAYSGWPALHKLERVDELVGAVAARRPDVRTRARDATLPRLRHTLREHYARKKAAYRTAPPWRYDRELLAVFRPGSGLGAATFLRTARTTLRSRVSMVTGAHRYVVDDALEAIAARCRQLELRVGRPRQAAHLGAAVLLTTIVLGYTQGGRPRFRR